MEKLSELIAFLKSKGLENKKIDVDVLIGIIEYFGKQAEDKFFKLTITVLVYGKVGINSADLSSHDKLY